MLSQLVAIHAELRAAIAALEIVLSPLLPDDEAASGARLRLSRVSSRRYSLIQCQIYPSLHDVSAEDARKIADLQTQTAALLVQSSEHIGQWTRRAIGADWPGYKRASARMRSDMLGRIADESAILYPLLKAKTARAA